MPTTIERLMRIAQAIEDQYPQAADSLMDAAGQAIDSGSPHVLQGDPMSAPQRPLAVSQGPSVQEVSDVITNVAYGRTQDFIHAGRPELMSRLAPALEAELANLFEGKGLPVPAALGSTVQGITQKYVQMAEQALDESGDDGMYDGAFASHAEGIAEDYAMALENAIMQLS